MKKILWAVGGVVVLMIATVLVVPSFINWNEYKGEITDRAKAATGRHLEILGDIKIGLLPAPAVRAERVRIANIEGASTADMVSLERLEVRVALGPLFSGQIQVRSIKLVKPVVNIEVLADGRSNLVFDPASGNNQSTPSPASSAPTDSGSEGSGGGAAIRIDDLAIEDGTVVYRDARAGQTERITNLNGRFAAASLTGPMETSGSAVVRGIPLSFEASVGAVVRGRTVPLTVDVQVIPGEVKTRLTGTLSGLSDAPRFKGKLTVDGKNLGDFVAGVAKGTVLPGALNKSFGLGADIQANKESARITSIIAKLAETQGTGSVTASFGDELGAEVDLTINRIDLDSILKPAALVATAPSTTSSSAGSDGTPKASAALTARRPASPSEGNGLKGFKFPAGINANLNLVVEALTFRGAPIRQAKLSASLANAELTLSQLSALFPGGSDVAVFGFATSSAAGPKFEGTVDATSNDLRSVLKWLDVPAPDVRAERLRKLKLSSKIEASATDIKIGELSLQIDNTEIKGAATVVLRDRPAIGANLLVDKINLDGYLPVSKSAPATGSPADAAGGAGPQADGASASSGTADPLAGLAALAGFDANLKAKIKALTLRGLPARNVDIDAKLFGGNITIRKFNVANIAGLKIGIDGGIEGFARSDGAVRPALKNLRFKLDAKNISRFSKLSGLKLPISPARLGAISLSTRLNGDLQNLRTATNFKAAGGVYEFVGTVAPLAAIPSMDARIGLKHPNFVQLLRLAGVAYRPAKSRFGGIDISGQVKGNLSRVTVSNLVSKLGSLSAKGTVTAELNGPRPKITADLTTGVVRIDDFLPAKQRASLQPPNNRPRIMPATWQPSTTNPSQLLHRIANHVRGRWPTDRLDLSVLRTLNADLNLKSDAVIFDKIRVDTPVIVANLQNGILQTRQLTGTVFGGTLNGNAKITENGRRSQYESRVNLTNVNVAQALKATGGVGSGRMTVAVDLNASGGSVAEIVGALNGAGSIRLAGLDVRGASRGSPLAPVLDLLSGLNQFAGAFSAKRGKGLADVQGSFRMERGIARFNDLTLASNVGNGAAQGTVDLPNWQVDSRGKIELAKNLIVQLLAQQTNAAQTLPFSIKGRLDAPTVKLETASLPNRGLPIPKSLLKKKGVGQILQGILGGGSAPSSPPPATSSTAPGTQAPPPPLEQGQQEKKPKVEDVLKGILRGLGG